MANSNIGTIASVASVDVQHHERMEVDPTATQHLLSEQKASIDQWYATSSDLLQMLPGGYVV